MRIAFFTHNSQLEGAPMFVLRLAAACKKAGHECIVYTPEEAPLNSLLRQEGISVVVERTLLNKSSVLPPIEADVCIMNTVVSYNILEKVQRALPHAVLLWCVHEAQRSTFEKELPELSAKHFSLPDCVIFHSKNIEENYSDLPTKRTAIIPNGLDVDAIQNHIATMKRRDVRQKYSIPFYATVITTIGSVIERKGQREFVEAAINLVRKHPTTPLHFVIAGRCSALHDTYREALITRIAEAGLTSRFTFLPATKDPLPYYALSDIFVCASYLEAFPYVVLEAMACRLPIVASNTYGVRDMLEDRISGLTVIPAHIRQLTEKISYLIEHPHVADRLADAAQRRVATLYTQTGMYEEFLKLFTLKPQQKKPDSYTPPPKNQKKWIHRMLYKLWLLTGSPAPRLARYIRYNILRPVWPVLHEHTHTPQGDTPKHTAKKTNPDVAVVIPCHNYGKYLSEAIDSVLAQTLTPKQIVVVDDSSTDNTARIARSYADKGVEFVQGSWGNVGKARNAGMEKTTAQFLVFLDADDRMHPQYLACGVEALNKDRNAGIAYPNMQMFGNSSAYHKTPIYFDAELFDRNNHINTIAMVRRTALMQAGGWAEETGQHLDWITWRRVMQLGWKAVKSEGLHFYRQHDKNMFDSYRSTYSYAERSGLLTEPTTMFIALSGRSWMWPLTAKFLEKQTLNHNQIHLVLIDTSHDEAFRGQVRSWLAQCDYRSTTYHRLKVGRAGLADLPREQVAQQVRDAVAQIYNTCARLCTTATACFLEDDILPPYDAYPRLLSQLEPDVISVSGYYCHRGTTRAIAWNWKENGLPYDVTPQEGTTVIGGTGFGCLVMRGMYLRNTVFSSGPPRMNYDHNFFFDIHNHPKHKALIDWSIRCQHHSSPTDWS